MTGSSRPSIRRVPLVLVVDDFEDTRTIYGDYLRFAGFRVVLAHDGVDALAKARTLLPEVAVMDLAMPKMDGWTAIKHLRRDPRTKDIFLMAVTGFVEEHHRVQAWSAGCDAFIEKPVLPAELVRRIVARLAARSS
jgi:two-component system, cell cycle response regulator DivK